MKDLNFFLPYKEASKESKKTNVILAILAAAVILYVLGTTVWYFSNRIVLANDIKKLKTDINNVDLQKQYKESDVIIKKYELLNKYNEGVTTKLSSVTSKDIGSSSIMKTFFATLPQDVSIASISINSTTVQLQCTSSNRISIAELQRNLLQLDIITSAEVSGITGDSTKNSYGFLVKCILKGVEVK